MTTPLDGHEVASLHRNDDVDSRPEAHHHTLGRGRNQSSPGSHVHDGITSEPILSGVTFTGSRTTNQDTILNQICDALALLGATNSTGP